MSKVRKICIFCGNSGVTKEHIWPAWLIPHLPSDAINHESLSETRYPTHTAREIKKHSGSPHSGRLRIVCRICNNGWMSVLQNQTKPILLPLILGEKTTLFRKDQSALATWITMFAIVAEFKSKSERWVAVSGEQRLWFEAHKMPPKHWKIWIGYFKRQTLKGVYFHNVLPIFPKVGMGPTTEDGYPLPNTQTTSIAVGNLYAHLISTDGPGIVERQRITTAPVIQLWPITKSPIVWPRISLTDEEVEKISMAFIRGAERRAGLK